MQGSMSVTFSNYHASNETVFKEKSSEENLFDCGKIEIVPERIMVAILEASTTVR